jgi:hypothetical protein
VIRLLLACVSVSAAMAYSPVRTANGNPLHRTDAEAIRFFVNTDGAPAGSIAALQAAVDAWSSIPTSVVRFLPLESTSGMADPLDRRNTIVFADTPENRSVVGSALAVTALIHFENGDLVDTDIIFNPSIAFSTDLAIKTYDLQSVATHELGHALGANHSGLLAATMFQATAPQNKMQTKLSADDMAFVTDYYASPAAADAYSVIAGKVSTADGIPVRNALLVAADPATGITVGGISSLSDGGYSLKAPRGRYLVYAEPLDAPVTPEDLYLSKDQVDRAFLTTFSSQLVDTKEGPGAVDIYVGSGAASFDLQIVGTGRVAGSGDVFLRSGGATLTAGQPVDLVLSGPGLESDGAVYEVRVLGSGISVRPDSIRLDSRIRINDAHPLRATIDVALEAGPIASVVVVKDSVAVVLSGSLVVVAPPPAHE